MTRLEQYLDVVSKRVQKPYGIVNSAALARLVNCDLPKLFYFLTVALEHRLAQDRKDGSERLDRIEEAITDEDLKVWGYPEDLLDAVSKAGTDPDDLPNF